MNKIIFLDIDGVLNVMRQDRDKFGQCFHKHFENNLRWIINQTGAKIVITSIWRMDGLSKMQKMWNYRNLPGDVIGIIPIEIDIVKQGNYKFYDQVNRGFEIQQWIEDNNVKCYCIIDDDNDMLSNQKNNFVQTANNPNHFDSIDIGYGLTRKCAKQVIEILNKN